MSVEYRPVFAAAMIAGVLGLALGARAANITSSANPPSTNILAGQLSSIDITQDSNGDYTDNAGPVGETFTLAGKSLVNAITILGNGDDNLDLGQNFHIEIGSVDPVSGLITQLATPETAPQDPSLPASGYLTFNLATPLTLNGGSTTYEFSIYTDTATPGVTGDWYGLAHSTAGTHPGNGGTGFNYDKTTTNTDDNMNGIGKNNGWPTPGYVAPNIHNYEYVFAVQGTVVPEPAGLGALLAVGALMRRRRA